MGEATNPGPSDVAPTQWDSGAEFSYALEVDLTQRQGNHDEREVVVEEASHSNPSQAAPTQWDLTARDVETEDEQSDIASCMSTGPAEGRVVSVVGANLEQVPTHVIDALQEDLPVSRRHRRLVLVSAQELVSSHDQVEPTAVDSPADSPSDSGHSASVMEVVPEVFEVAGRRFLHTGLEFLDSVDLHVVFRTRVLVMQSVLVLLKGAFKAALICAMREVLEAMSCARSVLGKC